MILTHSRCNLLSYNRIDLEYKLSGHQKLVQSWFGSALFCHGAIAVWEIKTVLDVLSNHNGTHHGDDLQMGLILQGFAQHYQIKGVGHVCVQVILILPSPGYPSFSRIDYYSSRKLISSFPLYLDKRSRSCDLFSTTQMYSSRTISSPPTRCRMGIIRATFPSQETQTRIYRMAERIYLAEVYSPLGCMGNHRYLDIYPVDYRVHCHGQRMVVG